MIDEKHYKHIALSNSWFKGEHYLKRCSSLGLLIYCQLALKKGVNQTSTFTLNILLDELKVSSSSSNGRKTLVESIIGLHSLGLITIYKDWSLTSEITIKELSTVRFNTPLYATFPPLTEHFTLIRVDEIEDILHSPYSTQNKKGCLALWGSIVMHINKEKGYCYPGQKLLMKEACIGRTTTFVKYRELLEELNILFVQSVGYVAERNGTEITYKGLNDRYSRVDNMEKTKLAVQNLIKCRSITPQGAERRGLQNEKRRLKQKINALCKKRLLEDRPNTPEEIELLREYRQQYNELEDILKIGSKEQKQYVYVEHLIEEESPKVNINAPGSTINIYTNKNDIPPIPGVGMGGVTYDTINLFFN